MKYLCLIYENEQAWAATPQSEADAIMREYFAFGDDYTRSGHVLGGNALQPTHTATTVRVRNGKTSTTDGPFAETREQLGGFYLIDVPDLDAAIAVAKKVPVLQDGAIEIRPLLGPG